MRSGMPDAPELSVVLTPRVGAARSGKHLSHAHLLPSAVALTVLLSGCAYPVPVAVQQPATVTTTTTTSTTPGPAGTADGAHSAGGGRHVQPGPDRPDDGAHRAVSGLAAVAGADGRRPIRPTWPTPRSGRRRIPSQKGDAAVQARSQNQPWDPSVQSLVAFPQVLQMMGEKPDWVQNLGDAFLASSKDVLDSAQRLRAKAQQTAAT